MKKLNRFILIISLVAYSLNISAAKPDEEAQITTQDNKEYKSRFQRYSEWVEKNRKAIAITIAIATVGFGAFHLLFKAKPSLSQLEYRLNAMQDAQVKLNLIKQKLFTASHSEKQNLLNQAYMDSSGIFYAPTESALDEAINTVNTYITEINRDIKDIIKQKKSP